MINHIKSILPTLLVAALIAMNAYGQYPSDSTSPNIGQANTQTMILCPTYTVAPTVNGAAAPTVNLNSSIQTVKLGDSGCTGGSMSNSAAVWVAYLGGGAFTFNCPPDHPYLGNITETWSLVMIFGVLGMGGYANIQCCTGPQPQMYLSNSQTSSWQSGTACP